MLYETANACVVRLYLNRGLNVVLDFIHILPISSKVCFL